MLLLDGADGNTWVMKGFHLGLHPTHTCEQFGAVDVERHAKLAHERR